MKILKARFRITTPMFIGEATAARGNAVGQIQCADGVRPTAIKGVLRQVWRALNWARVRQAHSDDETALKALHAEEAALFGSAAQGSKSSGGKSDSGQSAVLLRVTDQRVKPAQAVDGNNGQPSQALQYLLGMGLYHFKSGLLRSHLAPGGEFTVELAMKPSMSDDQRRQLRDALMWFGLTGSLGSRARKGFGSVTLLSLTDAGEMVELPQSPEQYRDALQGLISPCRAVSGAPFSAVCAETLVQVSANGQQALELLARHGHELGLYRGYGRAGDNGERRIFGQKAEGNFADDHDWAYAVANGDKPHAAPRRAIFGLPHPYRLNNADNKQVSVESSTGRRASPLIAHIHELANDEYLLVHLLLESQFLPASECVEVSAGHNKRRIQGKELTQSLDWGVLHDFLARFEKREIIDG